MFEGAGLRGSDLRISGLGSFDVSWLQEFRVSSFQNFQWILGGLGIGA